MTLNDWLKKEGITQAELARRMGVVDMTVSGVMTGRRRFSPENARKVVEVTNGEVTLEEILFPDDFKNASGG